MVLAKKSRIPRRRNLRKGKGKGRRGGYRKAKDVLDMASLSVKRSLSVGPNPGFATNVLYSLMNTQLTDFTRATQVAAAYQHYRIKKITLTFKPSSDTFTPTQATKPNLYYMIDKSGAIPTNATLEALKQMGAKPIQLDEKNLTVSWRPSVLESVMYASGGVGASSASKYQISPWLTTSADNVSPGVFIPSGIDHLGCYWYVDQLIPQGYQYTVECEVQFQFKKPLINLVSGVSAVPVNVAPINNSPDGIVGGGDGE